MTALSALNTIHKTGLFGNCQNKEKSELTTVSEVKDIQIIQIVHYSKSTVKISSINLDNLKFPEEAMHVNSNNETRIFWNGPNNWIVVSNNKEILSKLGYAPRDLMRKKENAYTEYNLDNPSLSDDDLIEFMVKYPVLIERPIVLANEKAAIGRPPEQVLKIL